MTPRAWIGAGLVLAVGAAVSILLIEVPGVPTLAVRLLDHATRRLDHLEVRFPKRPELHVGDPVYSVEGESFALQGRVVSLEGPPWIIVLELDPIVRRRLGSNLRVTAMEPDGNLGWVLRTLLPPPLRRQVLAELKQVWESKKDDILSSLQPQLLALAGEIASVLAETFPDALKQHEAERDRFLAVFKEEIFERELRPMLEAEFVTRLEERLGPLAGNVGSEVWDAIGFKDIMALGWIATKDLVGAAGREEMAQRLTRLIKEKAVPVFQKHAPVAFREAMAAVMEGLSAPRVREALEQSLSRTLEHPAFHEFAGAVIDTWIAENPRLKSVLRDALQSEDLRKPIEELYEAAEPTLEAALEEMLTRKDRKGMDHQLVRVLRRVVLKKDKHYLVLESAKEGDEDIARGAVLDGVIGTDP